MTETSTGFDTAVAVATEALDRLQPTAASHDRVMILEVMGRDAGHIALAAGIAGGSGRHLDSRKWFMTLRKWRQKDQGSQGFGP
jgi:6-phosphofructokinase